MSATRPPAPRWGGDQQQLYADPGAPPNAAPAGACGTISKRLHHRGARSGRRWGDRDMVVEHCTLKSAGALRNAVCRNRCLINGFSSRELDVAYETPSTVLASMNQYGIKNGGSRRQKMSNPRISQIASALYLSNALCKREAARARHAAAMADALSSLDAARPLCPADGSLGSYFDFIVKLVDIWTPERALCCQMKKPLGFVRACPRERMRPSFNMRKPLSRDVTFCELCKAGWGSFDPYIEEVRAKTEPPGAGKKYPRAPRPPLPRREARRYKAFTQFTRSNGIMTASPGGTVQPVSPRLSNNERGPLTFAEYWGTYVLPNINNPRGLCRIDARSLLDAFPRRCKGVNGYPAFGVPPHRAARLGR